MTHKIRELNLGSAFANLQVGDNWRIGEARKELSKSPLFDYLKTMGDTQFRWEATKALVGLGYGCGGGKRYKFVEGYPVIDGYHKYASDYHFHKWGQAQFVSGLEFGLVFETLEPPWGNR